MKFWSRKEWILRNLLPCRCKLSLVFTVWSFLEGRWLCVVVECYLESFPQCLGHTSRRMLGSVPSSPLLCGRGLGLFPISTSDETRTTAMIPVTRTSTRLLFVRSRTESGRSVRRPPRFSLLRGLVIEGCRPPVMPGCLSAIKVYDE